MIYIFILLLNTSFFCTISATDHNYEQNLETIHRIFPFKELTAEAKQLAYVPCPDRIHLGAYRYYWDVPSMQYFSNQVKDGQTVLEIGCATGKLSFQLCREKPNARIIALDFNIVGIDEALHEQSLLTSSDNLQFHNITFECYDFSKQFFYNRTYNFDHISFFNVAHLFTPHQLHTAFCNIRNCLTADGTLYFSMVAMIASVKNDNTFMKKYTDALTGRHIKYPGYVYGTSTDLSGDQSSFTYDFAENMKNIPFPYQDVENKKTLFLGDHKTIKQMMEAHQLKPKFMFYSSARCKKHFIKIEDAMKEAGDFTLHIIAQLDTE
ncbi:MAG: hypothetical protein C0432_02345 [Candidatus Puniceispirillum sp.]|nr:hypothetical protein [Candidatus Pelagibacter sp.]MBA4283115.1 hypothetical protein [Candidatus Puniceispirillum sp.]